MQTDIEMSNYRLEKAAECLNDAKAAFQAERYSNAANRSYYCVFHSMRSVLALESIDFKKHSAVIAYFSEHYIKSGKFEKSLSKIIKDLFRLRGKSDYDDFYVISKQDVAEQVENAELFFKQVKAFLSTH